MSRKTIPSAKDFLRERYSERDLTSFNDNVEALQEFAKLHIEPALQEASKVLDVDADGDYIQHPTSERILNAYSLANIK